MAEITETNNNGTRRASILRWVKTELDAFKEEAIESDQVRAVSIILRFKHGAKSPRSRSLQLERVEE